jgi:hypothetical protein
MYLCHTKEASPSDLEKSKIHYVLHRLAGLSLLQKLNLRGKEKHLKYPILSTPIAISLLIAGCTTIPTPSADFSSNGAALESATGLRTKRLATLPPNPPIEFNAKLMIDAVQYLSQPETFNAITLKERSLVANALSRSACKYFSRHFEIVDASSAPPSIYTLRIRVTRLDATSRLGAAFGIASGVASPFGGIRPPIGLGGLTVEFELVSPNGGQAAAMVWSRHADVFATSSASSIGDAYRFASMAPFDFEKLATRQANLSSGNQAKSRIWSKPDKACDSFGQDATGLARVASFLGLPLPPESVDKSGTQ